MFTHRCLGQALLAAALAGFFDIAVAAPATVPVPGSWPAIMAVKDPANYGPHRAAATEPGRALWEAPAAGSFAAIMSIKDPQHYGPQLNYVTICGRSLARTPVPGVECRAWRIADLAAARTAPARTGPRPGSWAALMSVKDPQHYGPRIHG